MGFSPYKIPVVGPMFFDDPGAKKAADMRQQASSYVQQKGQEDAQTRQRLLEQRMAMFAPMNAQFSRLYGGGSAPQMPDVKGYFAPPPGSGGGGGPTGSTWNGGIQSVLDQVRNQVGDVNAQRPVWTGGANDVLSTLRAGAKAPAPPPMNVDELMAGITPRSGRSRF